MKNSKALLPEGSPEFKKGVARLRRQDLTRYRFSRLAIPGVDGYEREYRGNRKILIAKDRQRLLVQTQSPLPSDLTCEYIRIFDEINGLRPAKYIFGNS